MTTTPRPRFSVRASLAEPTDDGPFDGVPEHLLVPLQSWVKESLTYGNGTPKEEAARDICLRLRIAPITSNPRLGPQYREALMLSGTDLLDVVDEILAYSTTTPTRFLDSWKIVPLQELLDNAGSAYRVTDSRDGLEERVTPAVRDAVRQTMTDAAAAASSGSAADHLSTAWQAAYGRSPDPQRAYSEAIKAVEAAAHAVVQSKNQRATLGTMLGEIGNARHKFDTAISTPPGKDPMAPVEAMMRALWEGQTSRHGGQAPTVAETLEAARAGVHLAAALVQWFVSGAVVRNP
ncbi:hypothetical protein OHA79_51985 (plasmid) [Streptomyces sp. NBC_00841]|uniref:hypothetical protein n=1 Tax=Streptomyces sp. NBC_00841 TaxID=2975847 RepID=UPI002DD8081F|nr:hypothetical protein [Streptomyces sp. NBC_00841]WSA06004.1 hypothetical protein OHA79_51985 [Streptomyces sp. NBC_00841]